MGKKAKVIGAAAAGVAAAATAAVVVTRKGKAKKITEKVTETVKAAKKKAVQPKLTVYHVKKSGDQWAVEADGAARASSLHPNKAQALKAARELAQSKAPAELVIHRVDGSVQDSHTYEEE